MQSTTQQVRQVLVNELGLTRDSVREEAEAYIRQTIDRMWGQDIPRLVKEEVGRVLNDSIETYQRGGSKIKELIQQEIRQQVTKAINIHLNGKLAITLETQPSQTDHNGGLA